MLEGESDPMVYSWGELTLEIVDSFSIQDASTSLDLGFRAPQELRDFQDSRRSFRLMLHDLRAAPVQSTEEARDEDWRFVARPRVAEQITRLTRIQHKQDQTLSRSTSPHLTTSTNERPLETTRNAA